MESCAPSDTAGAGGPAHVAGDGAVHGAIFDLRPVDVLAHAAARATSAAGDPSQAVSSFDETFKDHVVMPETTQSVAVRVVTDTAPPRAPRALSVSIVPLVLRL